MHLFSMQYDPALLAPVATWALLFSAMLFYRRAVRKVPGAMQVVVEDVVEHALGYTDKVVGDRALAARLLTVPAAMCVWVLACGLFALVPGVSAVSMQGADGVYTLRFVTLLREPTLWVAYLLALLAATEYALARTTSVREYAWRLVTLRVVVSWARGVVRAVRTTMRLACRLYQVALCAPRWQTALVLLLVILPPFVPNSLPVVTMLAALCATGLLALVCVYAAGATRGRPVV